VLLFVAVYILHPLVAPFVAWLMHIGSFL